MNSEQLDKLVQNLGISRDQILREEAEMFFLEELANSELGSKVIFYGGTALRLVYGSPRFSEDIDLLCIKKTSFEKFEKLIQSVVKENGNWYIKDIKDKKNTMFALFLIKDEKLKHNFSLKIELHKNEKTKLKTQLMLIKSPTSIFEPLVLVPMLTELKILKINALMDRKKARDIFDLWYISSVLKEEFNLPPKIPKYSEREFQNELQVFLPKKYYPIVKQLYAKINSRD